mmetsp:Transcript_36129/g.100315  ORF Transcript_36129/g.100315 Transcript_36129/m.100315 type:complete len:201 (+) Transcript_36129:443-1045(+)
MAGACITASRTGTSPSPQRLVVLDRRPARAARPTRCKWSTVFLANSSCRTCRHTGKSIPRAARSVQIRTEISPRPKRRSPWSRSSKGTPACMPQQPMPSARRAISAARQASGVFAKTSVRTWGSCVRSSSTMCWIRKGRFRRSPFRCSPSMWIQSCCTMHGWRRWIHSLWMRMALGNQRLMIQSGLPMPLLKSLLSCTPW